MPGLMQKNDRFINGSTPMFSLCSSNGFWSKHSDKVNYNQLQKFWNELSPQARQKLLRIDKQTLFEQARKNMYCSRCNGLLLEGFLQIIMYGKSLQQEGTGGNLLSNGLRVPRNQNDCDLTITGRRQDEILDPSVHTWGGLSTTRDGSLTLMDCYIHSKSLKGLENVFDSARARERERELLYPDACGVGGRGWISQGMAGYGRGHGTRETCALHTARLSCDTLVDFWSALGDETKHSLLRMKEEDFIERLMYRFDSKRFCRDCRRNVIREFKELKELKRLRKEPRCTTWFCVADTAFQYEVSYDTVQADWCDTFADIVGTYHHFEWAVGTGEGKSDILEFENVGLNGSVRVNGLDLSDLNSCFITLRAWKLDGRCTELCVKAHALNTGQCVHCQLVVGDGFVTIKSGESIRRFFELAEEAEEEEDDDSMDKDGNEIDGECSRPQKHAKSPELAREFLLDVATVIFKEQVEKAFREGTARQNAHSIFVSLALKLLEERVHVACKEIITLEKQMKLLEEEEKEKREEEERKERRRAKEKEKKLRRKERLKGKEKNRNKNCCEETQNHDFLNVSKDESLVNIKEPNSSLPCKDLVSEVDSVQSSPGSLQIQEQQFSKSDINSIITSSSQDEEATDVKDGFDSWTVEQSKTSHCRLKLRKQQMEPSKWPDRHQYAVSENGSAMNRSEPRYYGATFESPSKVQMSNRHVWLNGLNSNLHNCGSKHNERFHCSGSRMTVRNGIHYCCDYDNENRAMVEPHISAVGVGREVKSVGKSESALDMSKQFYRGNKCNHIDHFRDICGRQKNKVVPGVSSSGRDLIHPKKVWEPVESRKKYPRSNSDSDVTLKSSAFNVRAEPNNNLIKLSGCLFSGEIKENSNETRKDNKFKPSRNSALESDVAYQNGLDRGGQPSFNLKEAANEEIGSSPECSALKHVKSASSVTSPLMSCTSSSDNCSSCLSEGDSNTISSNNGNQDSSTSDSEDSSQQSEGKETTVCSQKDFCHSVRIEKNMNVDRGHPNGSNTSDCLSKNGAERTMLGYPLTTIACGLDNKFSAVSLGSQHPRMISPMHNDNVQFPMFQTPTLGYYNHNPVSWPAATDELMPFPHPSHYMYTSSLGFGVNGNSNFCMPYGSVQHLNSTLYAPGHVPIYQSVFEANGLNMEEQASVPCSMLEASNEADIEQRIGPVGPQSTQGASDSEGLQNGDSGKWHTSNDSFSLFHFGGPVALSTGSKLNPLLSKDERGGKSSPKCPTDPVDTDNAYNNKEITVEEYNLFAANNGITFSIF